MLTEPFLICMVSSTSPSYVNWVHMGVTASTSLSSNMISSIAPPPASAPQKMSLRCLLHARECSLLRATQWFTHPRDELQESNMTAG